MWDGPGWDLVSPSFGLSYHPVLLSPYTTSAMMNPCCDAFGLQRCMVSSLQGSSGSIRSATCENVGGSRGRTWGNQMSSSPKVSPLHFQKKMCMSSFKIIVFSYSHPHFLFVCLIPLIPIFYWIVWTYLILILPSNKQTHPEVLKATVIEQLSSICHHELSVLRMRAELRKWPTTFSCHIPIQTWRVWGYKRGDH